MFKILRVNMADLSVKSEDLPEAYQGLGGRGLTSAIVAQEVEPTCSAIGPNNKLIFAPGLLGAGQSGFENHGGAGPRQRRNFEVAVATRRDLAPRQRCTAGPQQHGTKRP